jgi:hypothetical protein
MTNELFIKTSIASNQLEKRQRIIYAAISGFIAGTICAVVSSFINVWVYPDLPIYISWTGVFGLWALWAGAGCVLAGVAAISSEGWSSIILAAFLMAATALIFTSVSEMTNLLIGMVILIALALPFTAIFAPVAYVFFWLSRRFMEARLLTGRERSKILVVNILVIILLGLLPGLYSKFNARTEQAVRLTHDLLQGSAQTLPPSLVKTEGFMEHRNQAYTLSQIPSVNSTEGVDVTAHYEDGYGILCTVILYPGSEPRVNPCKGLLP